jgi:hypothetical protein
MALVFRNCTDQQQQISGAPTVQFFLSEAGAGRLENSGEVPIRVATDFFQPGNQEDEKRMAPVFLNPGESAHVLLAYFDRPHANSAYSSIPTTRLNNSTDSCYAADVVTVESYSVTLAFRALMHICESVYVSEYRRGLPKRGERIRPEFLAAARPDIPGPEVTGPMLPSFALDKEFDIGLRNCEGDDLDIWYAPPDRTANPASMIIHFQNIWTHSCVVFYNPGFSFIKGQLFDRADVSFCERCSTPDEEPTWQNKPNLILPPNGRGVVTLRFSTSPYPQSICKETNGLIVGTFHKAFNVLKETHIRWSDPLQVCSRVQVALISPEEFETGRTPGADSRISLELTSERATYYDGEQISIHAKVEGPANLLPVDSRSCLKLFQRSRAPGGSTRYDPILWSTACNASASEVPGSNRVVEMDFDAGHRTQWSGHGEHRLDLLYIVPPEAQEGAVFARSNTLHLEIADASLIARTWGPKTEGVAADITLDHDTYAFGKDVALHVAVENFDSPVGVYALSGRCEGIVRIEVRTAEGLPVKSSGPVGWNCSGVKLSGLAEYPRGKVVAQELTLRELGLLPDRPGSFTVSAFWSVYACQSCATRDAKPYAVATSGPRAFRIVSRP